MNLEPDSGPREEGIDMGDIGEYAPDKSPCKMPKYAGIDSELAWWNGEIEGEEPN